MKRWLLLTFLLGLTSLIGILTQLSCYTIVQHDRNSPVKEVTGSLLGKVIPPTQVFSAHENNLSTSLMPSSLRTITSLMVYTYTPHVPIVVSSDAELAVVAISGLGTEIDPYVLEGWNITTSGVHGIYIHDTTDYFIIRNCWIETNSFLSYGIYLQDVAAGTATLVNNTCRNNRYGIRLERSESSTIGNNLCQQNWVYGIILTWSNYSVVAHNTCYDNDRSGIYLTHSWNSLLLNNTCYNNDEGIRLDLSDASTISNNTCYQNSDYGLYISFSDVTIIANNTCFNNSNGIYLRYSSRAMVGYNTCVNNSHGLALETSEYTTITHNICCYNTYTGIVLHSSADCIIMNNLLLENQGYGLTLDSQTANNHLHHNAFLANRGEASQARDEGNINHWYENTTKEGNYWLDYTGTGGYLLTGAGNATDTHPLADVLDFDGDGMSDGWEYHMGLNPASSDDASFDADDDGMPNLWEYQMGLNATLDDAANDHEGDGMPNLWEYQMGLNATLDDSAMDREGDGMPNLWEYQMGLNATNANDATFDLDKDGLTNLQEYQAGTDPYDSDSDDDFFSDGLDYGWWGNPRANWDNPLTRGLFLAFLLGLGIWVGFIAVQLPKLQEKVKQQVQHLHNQAEQLQQKITMFSSLESLQELEETAEEINQLVFTCEQTIQGIRSHVARKWLPFFLRPDLTPLDTINASVTKSYKEFQQTRISRVKEFMLDEGSFTVSTAENSTEHG
ncbi:MAG: NosD domain-containing protein [Promethearchaeota archaeon]